jgi:transcriptional regulator with XRE-family HTH domain
LVDCAAGFGYNGLSDVEREGGNMTLGETIKARREAAGMTQEELAERLYVSRQAVSKWEAGASVPNDDNLVQIRAILGVEETAEERAPEDAADGRKKGKRGALFAAGWTLACVFAALFIAGLILRAQPPENKITGVALYGADGGAIEMKDNWYTVGGETNIVVSFQGRTPDAVTVFVTPTGTETAEKREQLAVVTPPDGQSCALAHISLSEAAMGQLQVSADWGGKSETSEGINIYYEPEG